MFSNQFDHHSRLDIVRILLRFGGNFHRVALTDDANIALEITLRSGHQILRIRQQRPLVVELMI